MSLHSLNNLIMFPISWEHPHAASRTPEQFVSDEILMVLRPLNPSCKQQYSNDVWSSL